EHGAHRAAGDDAGAGDGGAQDHPPCPMPAYDVVVQRPRLAQRHADELALGLLGRLADGLGHLAGLAVAVADAALLVAHDHERGEAEAPAALHHRGHAVDVDQPVHELAVALLAATTFRNVSHRLFLLPPVRTAARPRGQRPPGP